MKVYTDSFKFNTAGEIQIINITQEVEEIVKKSGIKTGIAVVYAPHATGIIGLTEYESALIKDIKNLLETLVPKNKEYSHPGNAHSHLRSLLISPSEVVPVIRGELTLGTWQSIIWVETDYRPRTRKIIVTVIGE
ncbi:MAG: secondary thiamine-phosphate synthase enzyme YjbQ [Candidatus Odinarchaeia archaeon]